MNDIDNILNITSDQINDLKNINSFFDHGIVLVGSIVDLVELNIPMKDLDFVIDYRLFCHKFNLQYDPLINFDGLTIQHDAFNIRYVDPGIFTDCALALFQGTYNSTYIDIFLFDKDASNSYPIYSLNKKVFLDYNLVNIHNNLFKISKPEYRINSIKYILELETYPYKADNQRYWHTIKKQTMPGKLDLYYKKYPEYQ